MSGKRVNSDILEVLKRDSQVLASVTRDFENWVARKGTDIKIACFHEEEEVRGVGLVVTPESAKFGYWPRHPVRANHMVCCGFHLAGFLLTLLRIW